MESLTVCFEVHGFRVISAHSSAEALDVLGREMPALVLPDLNAPILDGPDFARELDRRGLSLPVVVMSSEPGAAEAARELGAVATLGKPFEVARLLATVGSIARTA
jgi:DNA-binding response OmpR family regulator